MSLGYYDDTMKVWVCAIAVLRCPMSVEDKIATLTDALTTRAREEGLPPDWYERFPPTGLAPFDAAVQNYLATFLQ